MKTITECREKYPFFVGDRVAFLHEELEKCTLRNKGKEIEVTSSNLFFMERVDDSLERMELSLGEVAFISEKYLMISQFRNTNKTISNCPDGNPTIQFLEHVLVMIPHELVEKLIKADRLALVSNTSGKGMKIL